MTAGAEALAARLAGPGGILLAPGVFDPLSALLAEGAGHEALYMTGYGVAATHGLPDAGLVGLSQMAERVALLAARTRLPLIADADTGFGGPLNLRHAVRAYEAAGAAAIQIEDQESPKKCGHVAGRRVAPVAEMVRRIRVAAEARSAPGALLIVARTDARTTHGLDEAIRRAEAYARAGADLLFVESPEDEAELARVPRALGGLAPVLANMVEGGRTPVLPAAALEAMGYRLAIHPGLGLRAAARAMRDAYAALRRTGLPPEAAAPGPGVDLHELLGLREALRFEARWLGATEEDATP